MLSDAYCPEARRRQFQTYFIGHHHLATALLRVWLLAAARATNSTVADLFFELVASLRRGSARVRRKRSSPTMLVFHLGAWILREPVAVRLLLLSHHLLLMLESTFDRETVRLAEHRLLLMVLP